MINWIEIKEAVFLHTMGDELFITVIFENLLRSLAVLAQFTIVFASVVSIRRRAGFLVIVENKNALLEMFISK